MAHFGLLLDIDGVIVRGRKVISHAVTAFQKLVDRHGRFRVPTVFVTNAGNSRRQDKALQLSQWLGIKISEHQVVMSHSPLRMFQQFHDKHCLISGQGPIVDIAHGLGFLKVSTIDNLRAHFPLLDAVDHKRRQTEPSPYERFFPKVEAVVLFGEPVRWETSLQLIIDVLMTSGQPWAAPQLVSHPHIPVLACNMDLQWMAEACLPRFGHGAFLLCLENLYKKITGKDMIYTALIGKPSEVTYLHAESCVQEEAQRLGIKHPVRHLFAIGDNINTDIYGANLYNRYLQRRRKADATKAILAAGSNALQQALKSDANKCATSIPEVNTIGGCGATSCSSILVHTGVYCKELHDADCDHTPRDFLPAEVGLKEPTYCVDNVLSAVELIFDREGFS
ncbi:haloacid dehalogenase-like hydrolase domain-containing 5 [Ornithodoros turicata]|uniref:Haloacid dehalogenase-like hydrolase domain-containing 5 n=1 Tax=Ornithodoros turicata TaxID=34597 RepID=A0A2R5LLQ3_9ACAR